MDGSDWVQRRGRAIAAHAAERAKQEAAEAGQARELIAEFVREARRRDLPVRPLSAQGYDGRSRYRTGLLGWYLRPDHTLAVGEDAEFYILTVPGSLRARLTGAVVRPSTPRLVIGEGARDGERIPLRELLRLRLERDEV